MYNFAGKFISISSIFTESGASKLKASEILVFSHLLDKSSFFAKADLGFFTDSDDARHQDEPGVIGVIGQQQATEREVPNGQGILLQALI